MTSLVATNYDLRGWVLLLSATERHYFVAKESLCGVYVPALCEEDYEARNHYSVRNCWLCEEALRLYPTQGTVA